MPGNFSSVIKGFGDYPALDKGRTRLLRWLRQGGAALLFLFAGIALCAIGGIRENVIVTSIRWEHLVAPMNVMQHIPRQRLSVFNVSPNDKHAFFIDDILNVLPRQKPTNLEMRVIYADGDLRSGTGIAIERQKIKVCGNIRCKQFTAIPPPKINPLRTATIDPSWSDEPSFFAFNFHRFLWPVETQRKFWPQLAYGERGLPLHLAQLPFESGSSSLRFEPSPPSKYGEGQREGSNQIVREIVSDRDRSPAFKITPALGTFIIIVAAICVFLGLGLIATGAHLTGILFVGIAVFGFWLPYYLGSLNRRSENVLIEPIVVSELKLRDVQRQIFGELSL